MCHNLRVDNPPEQDELDQIGKYLTAEFGGRTLPRIRELLRSRISEVRAAFDMLLARGLELGQRAVELEGGDSDVFIEGASNLLQAPEFANIEALRDLWTAP